MAKRMNAKQALDQAHAQVSTELEGMMERREDAVSTFRRTAEKLDFINAGAQVQIENLNASIESAVRAREQLQKLVEENTRVRERIVDIIGE